MAISDEAKNKFDSFRKGGAAAAPADPAPEGSEPTASADAPKPRGRGRPPKVVSAPAAEAPAATAPTPAAGMADAFTIPGDHGPLLISGDARDVLAALRVLGAA